MTTIDYDGDLESKKNKKRDAAKLDVESSSMETVFNEAEDTNNGHHTRDNRSNKKCKSGHVTVLNSYGWPEDEFDEMVRNYMAKDPKNNVVLRALRLSYDGASDSHFFTKLTELRSSPSMRIRRDFSEALNSQIRDKRGVYLVQADTAVLGYILNGLRPFPNNLKAGEFLPGVSLKDWDNARVYYEIDYGASEDVSQIGDTHAIIAAEATTSSATASTMKDGIEVHHISKNVNAMKESALAMWSALIEQSYAFRSAKQNFLPFFKIRICERMCRYNAKNGTFDKSLLRVNSEDEDCVDLALWLESVYDYQSKNCCAFILKELKEDLSKRMEIQEMSINAIDYDPGKKNNEIDVRDCFDKSNKWTFKAACTLFIIEGRFF